jgi:cytochrome b6-f complex iron-sulfur subunit
VTISGSTVSVNVAQAGIGAAGQFVIVQGADAIVVNIGTGFVALSKICTHSNCGLSGFNNSSGFLECNCHGSRFRTNGQVAVGPATTPLRSYTVSVNGGVVSFTV